MIVLGLLTSARRPSAGAYVKRVLNGQSHKPQLEIIYIFEPTRANSHAAADVTKTNTYHLQTFRTRDLGLLGYIDPDKIEYYRTPQRRHTMSS